METQLSVAKQSLDDSYWVQCLGITAIRVRLGEWLKLPFRSSTVQPGSGSGNKKKITLCIDRRNVWNSRLYSPTALCIDGNSSPVDGGFRRNVGITERKRARRWYLLPLLVCKSVVTTTVISLAGRDGRDWTRLIASQESQSVLEKESHWHVQSYVIKELVHGLARDTVTGIINELSFFRRAWSNGFSNFCTWLEESWCIIEMHHLWRPLWCASNSSLWTLLLLSCMGF